MKLCEIYMDIHYIVFSAFVYVHIQTGKEFSRLSFIFCTSSLKRNNMDTLFLADSITTVSQNNNSFNLELSSHISKKNKNYFFFLQIFPLLKHVQKIHCFLPYCHERQNFQIQISVLVSFARLGCVLIASSQITPT